jgi:xylulokinase
MGRDGYLLGFDVGSSSIKASLVDAATGKVAGSATSPKTELAIMAPRPGWAEQDPAVWWENAVAAAAELRAATGAAFDSVKAVGIAYQMHGLVLVDGAGAVLRPAIIWCDSRAVGQGERALRGIGEQVCLSRLLNSPGNFTASKLAWVKENEPDVFGRARSMLLPGDWLAFRMTGERATTVSGLSEAILWDFAGSRRADVVLDWFGIPRELVPPVVPTFSVQGGISAEAARVLGLRAGTPVSYRAGDQPNNAFSLNVLDPGEAATTAGTSGVVYGIIKEPMHDPGSRVNAFVHVNNTEAARRYGVLMCVNGTGIFYSWLRRLMAADSSARLSYDELNLLAAQAPVGADGLAVLPYGNGAERTLGNRDLRASVHGLDLNRHGSAHMVRAAQEGIAFALRYGMEIMEGMGLAARTVRAGHANMFMSPLFREAFATVSGARVELFDTDGAQGAARGAGLGAGVYASLKEAFTGLTPVRTAEPDAGLSAAYADAYGAWKRRLERELDPAR